MASFWNKLPKQKGAQLAQPPTGGVRMPTVNAHSVIGGNGQHLVLPPRTGGQPWIGHMGRAAMSHPFSPADTFNIRAGGAIMPQPSRLLATTPAAVNSITGQAAGTFQLAPGGGFNQPLIQTAPGSVGK